MLFFAKKRLTYWKYESSMRRLFEKGADFRALFELDRF